MKRSVIGVVAVAALGAVLAGGVNAQGWGGNGPRGGRGACPRVGNGAVGRGPAAGWVNAQTPEQRTALAQLTDLRTQVRAARQDLAALQARNAPAPETAQKEQELAARLARLQRFQTENAAILAQRGLTPSAGLCDGTGPRGFGGRGAGRGSGWGPRDGSGPNPNCPLKQ